MLHFSQKPSQLELFPGNTPSSPVTSRGGLLFSNLTLSLENIIIVAIVFVLGLVLSFSLGVERGKAVVKRQNLDIETPNRQRAGNSKRLILPGKRIPMERVPGEMELTRNAVKTSPVNVKAVLEVKPPEDQPSTGGMYTVQVASYKKEKNAKQEAETLNRIGHEIFVMSKGKHSIVCVGRFDDKSEAQKVQGKIKNKYKDCLVRRL